MPTNRPLAPPPQDAAPFAAALHGLESDQRTAEATLPVEVVAPRGSGRLDVVGHPGIADVDELTAAIHGAAKEFELFGWHRATSTPTEVGAKAAQVPRGVNAHAHVGSDWIAAVLIGIDAFAAAAKLNA